MQNYFFQDKSSCSFLSDLEQRVYKDLLEFQKFSTQEKILESLLVHYELLEEDAELAKGIEFSTCFDVNHFCSFMNYVFRVQQYLGIESNQMQVQSNALIYELFRDTSIFLKLQFFKNFQIPCSLSLVWAFLFLYGWRLWKQDKSDMNENTIAHLNIILREVCLFQ